MKSVLFGIVVPAVVFAISFFMTEMLFRHFSKTEVDHEKDGSS